MLLAGFTRRDQSIYRQVKIMKHAGINENYVTLTKRVKLQHKKKPVSNLKSVQSLGSEQTFTKFIEIFILEE